jgi:O-acetylhomoserine (thiol)-lyase
MTAAMRTETLAIHGGFDGDPATGAAAVPIYQSAAFLFDSADHGAALFNLEVDGFRYSRISNPTVSVLEERVAAMEGGVGALAVASGQAALYYALANLADGGGNIVCTPQLYGTSHTLLSHVLPRQGVQGRFAADDSAGAIAALIDENTRAVFCESVGNPAASR